MQVIPPLPRGGAAACHRCDRLLERRTHTRYDLSAACAAAILVLLPPGVFLPLMDSTIRNLVFGASRLVSSVGVIYREVWFPFAFGFFFFAFLFPWLRALLQLMTLGSLRLGWRIWQHGRIFRFSEELRIWSMTDVVVLAGMVAWLRARIPAEVTVRVGAWCYVVAAVLAIIGDRALDRRAVWNAILPDRAAWPGRRLPSCDVCELAADGRRSGDPCPRCGARLDRRIEPRLVPALAAVLSAIPLALPAYSAAIMINDQITGVLEQTVLGTVQLLADRGYWEFGVIVLFAGVAIPVVETIGLLWLLARVRYPSERGLVTRTRMYRTLKRLVRWPMVLPFIAAIAAPIINYRGIDEIVAGPGATPLFAIIALLMLAVRLFEPRLMWKSAGESA